MPTPPAPAGLVKDGDVLVSTARGTAYLQGTGTALTANELRDTLAVRDEPGRTVATTTVLTVLSRLERKGFVARTRDVRPHRFVQPRELLTSKGETFEQCRMRYEVAQPEAARDGSAPREARLVPVSSRNVTTILGLELDGGLGRHPIEARPSVKRRVQLRLR